MSLALHPRYGLPILPIDARRRKFPSRFNASKNILEKLILALWSALIFARIPFRYRGVSVQHLQI
jgi:hypothetical protein